MLGAINGGNVMVIVLIKIIILCIIFHYFNLISMRVLTLLNIKQIRDYIYKYYDCRWSEALSRKLCQPKVYRYFVQFNPGGIAFFIYRTILAAKINKVDIFKALCIQIKVDALFLNVDESNFRSTHEKLTKIIGK